MRSLVSSSQAPSNCRFECGDANKGFKQYYNKFDVVHARCISSGIQDLGAYLEEMLEVLKPGGVLLYLDGCPLIGEDLNSLDLITDETSPVRRTGHEQFF